MFKQQNFVAGNLEHGLLVVVPGCSSAQFSSSVNPHLCRRALLEERQNKVMSNSWSLRLSSSAREDEGFIDLDLNKYREWKGGKKQESLTGLGNVHIFVYV